MLLDPALELEPVGLIIPAQPRVAGIAIKPHEPAPAAASIRRAPPDDEATHPAAPRLPGDHHSGDVQRRPTVRRPPMRRIAVEAEEPDRSARVPNPVERSRLDPRADGGGVLVVSRGDVLPESAGTEPRSSRAAECSVGADILGASGSNLHANAGPQVLREMVRDLQCGAPTVPRQEGPATHPQTHGSIRKLAGRIGNIYLRSGLESDRVQTTSFVAVIGPETAWPGSKPRSFQDLGDGTHDTLIVVEVPDGQFLWMEPRDLEFDSMSFRINDGSGRGLGSRLGGARVVSADGSVRTLPDDFDGNKLRAMLTANGGKGSQE